MVARSGSYRVQSLQFQGAAYEALLRPLVEGRYSDIPRELLIEGPTGTGKSVVMAAAMHYFVRSFPGVNAVVLRRIKVDLGGSFMQMFEEEILDWNDPWDRYALTNGTGAHVPTYRSRDVYKFPNGSKVWCLGMDQRTRVKSKAYDWIWPMEGTEFEEDDFEMLHTRKRARVGVRVPLRILLSDVNPEYPQHWINQRAIRGDSQRIKTTLRDNPGYYNLAEGKFKPDGEEYLDELRLRLHGPNAARYIDGEWVSAEGQILDFEVNKHTFRGEVEHRKGGLDRIVFPRTHPVLGDFVEIVGFAGAYDWGDKHAGTLQVWGVDREGRQYLVEEVYHSKRALHWWAEWAVSFWKKYALSFIVCDNAAKDTINHFNHELEKEGGARARIAIECLKRSGQRQMNNLEVLREAFSDDRDGKPWVFLRQGALAHAPDQIVTAKCLQDEIPSFVYAPFDAGRHSGRPEDRPDRRCTDDGLDACCYMRVMILGGRRPAEKIRPDVNMNSPHELMRAEYWKRNDVA